MLNRGYLAMALCSFLAACQTNLLTQKVDNGQIVELKDTDFILDKDTTFRPLNDLEKEEMQSEKFCPTNSATVDMFSIKIISDEKLKSEFKSGGGGTSLTRNHDMFSNIWERLGRAAFVARARNDDDIAESVIHQLSRFAEANVLLETEDPPWAFRQKCWQGPNSPCPAHHVQTAADFFANAVHISILLRKWLHEYPARKRVIDDWLNEGFDYVKGTADLQGTGKNGGLYEYMNQHIGVLFYAIYWNDSELFMDYAKHGISLISGLLNDEGYIFNNSYRGSRALWYHSLGLDGVFGFGEMLEAQGIVFFNRPDLKIGLRNAYLAALKGERDWKWFESKGTKGTNFITDAGRARRHLHQLATALTYIGRWRYPDTRVATLPASYDKIIGVYPICMYADRSETLGRSR